MSPQKQTLGDDDTTKSTSILCPFTLKSLATIKPENVAVIYESNPLLANVPSDGTAQKVQCGHSCTLSNLVSYLHDSGGSKSCPVCQASPAAAICDLHSSTSLVYNATKNMNDQGSTLDKNDGRVVTFRYGTTFYFLWVKSSSPLQSSSYSKLFSYRKGNALDRIGSVLGMDVRTGLKIIHKGKVIYPDTSGKDDNYNEISEQLLDISNGDLIHRRKKPSLVVMGLRQQATAVANRSIFIDLLSSVARWLTPWHVWKIIVNGFQWSFRTTASLVGGICLFIRSMLYPPEHTQ